MLLEVGEGSQDGEELVVVGSGSLEWPENNVQTRQGVATYRPFI